MSGNSFGNKLKIHSFGESHGSALGVVIDGCPAGVPFNEELLRSELSRRRPGSGDIVSARNEADQPEVLSGVFEGRTLGTPIAILVRNSDQRSEDYNSISKQARTGHADDVWKNKYHHTDHRGGGRSSGRETVSRVMAGAVARMLLQKVAPELQIFGYASQIGSFELSAEDRKSLPLQQMQIDSFPARFPSDQSESVRSLLLQAKETGESYGGRAELLVKHMLPNLGQPVFHKLKADLAAAMMSVGATDSFQIFDAQFDSAVKGTEFHQTKNSYGGIRGGISTGADLCIRVGFKPTSSILDVAKKGRHDPCIVTRAIPVLEAMAMLVIADHYLWSLTDRV